MAEEYRKLTREELNELAGEAPRVVEAPAAAVDAPSPGTPPRLAGGIDLIGEYENSGFKEAPYIARRADGQVVQMPKLLYFVAEAVDGRRNYSEIAEHASK